MFNCVLVPLDATRLSEKVLAAAFQCVAPDGHLMVLRVRADAASLDNAETTRVDLNVVEQETHATLRRVLAAAKQRHVLARITAEVRSGPVASIILAAAEEAEADLIVMGTHGRKGFADHLMGSISEQIVAKSPASVFVIKAAGFPFLQD